MTAWGGHGSAADGGDCSDTDTDQDTVVIEVCQGDGQNCAPTFAIEQQHAEYRASEEQCVVMAQARNKSQSGQDHQTANWYGFVVQAFPTP